MLLSHPQEQVWKGTDSFWLHGAGTVSQGGPTQIPLPPARTRRRAQHAARLAQQRHSQNHTQLCPSSHPGLRQLQGLGEHSPTSTEGGKEEMAPSLVPELLPEEMPALVLGRGLWLTHHAAAPTRTIHSPGRPGAPCHLGCSTCAHVPKHERMACAVEAGPVPCPPRPPARCEAHAMAGR